MQDIVKELEAIAAGLLTHGGGRLNFASGRDDLKIPQQQSERHQQRVRTGHLSTGPRPPDDEVIAKFHHTIRSFAEQYEKHTRPYVPGTPTTDYIGGCCGHLRDKLFK